jgi:hypothetical protein
MHKPRPDRDDPDDEGRTIKGKSALHQVLESVVRFEKGKVITGPADSVGLMLFNVDVSRRCRTQLISGESSQEHRQLQTRYTRLSESSDDQRRGD